MPDDDIKPAASASQPGANAGDRVSDSNPTNWLIKYEGWLRILARREIDSRFHGKFSASDAVQQTMIEAWKGWDGFRGENEAQRRAWLRQILAHQLAHLARQYAGTKKRDITREVTIEQSLAQSAAKLENILQTHVSSPSRRAIQNEQNLELASALDQLPDDYRTVITLRNLDDLSHAEVATRMGRTEGAVRMLWVRALSELRDLIEAPETHNQE